MSIHISGKPVPEFPAAGRSTAAPPPVTTTTTSLLVDAPAVSRLDWLPEGAFPVLDELRAEQARLGEMARQVSQETSATKARFEREGVEYHEAVCAQVTDPSTELPALTPPEERAATLAQLQERSNALAHLLDQFARRAVTTITEHYHEWVDDLNARDGEVQQRVEAARAALAEAEAEHGATIQLRAWLQRTAGHHPRFRDLDGRHIAYPDLSGAGVVPGSASEAPAMPSAPSEPSALGRAQLLAERAARFDTTATTTPEEDPNA
jgi:hypothetical protein